MKNYRVKIVHDPSSSTFKDDDCHYPLMYDYGRNEGKDFSNGDIDEYLKYYLSSSQIIYHQKKILELIDDYCSLEIIEDSLDKDDKINALQDAIIDWIPESIENKVAFCKAFNIIHFNSESRGYSQGDWANVLIVPTPKNAEILGYDLKKITKEQLKSDFKTFEYWAWGDVFGFKIEKRIDFTKVYKDGKEIDDCEWEQTDSCYGFYGRDAEENGMIDNISYEEYGFTREEMIALINDAEVEY